MKPSVFRAFKACRLAHTNHQDAEIEVASAAHGLAATEKRLATARADGRDLEGATEAHRRARRRWNEAGSALAACETGRVHALDNLFAALCAAEGVSPCTNDETEWRANVRNLPTLRVVKGGKGGGS